MNCKFCGAHLPEGGTICPECKHSQCEPYAEGDKLPPRLNAAAFWRQRYFRKAPVILSMILCFAAAALAFYIGYHAPTIRLMCILDVALIAGCGLFIGLFRSRLFAAILSVYAVVMTVLTFVNAAGLPSVPELVLRALVLAASALGACGCFRFRCRYKRYKHEYRLRTAK